MNSKKYLKPFKKQNLSVSHNKILREETSRMGKLSQYSLNEKEAIKQKVNPKT